MTTVNNYFSDGCSSCGCSTTYEASGTIIAPNDEVVLLLPGDASTLALQVADTWTGTIKVEGTVDGVNYIDLSLFTLPAGALQTNILANGAFQASVAGFKQVRARGHSDFAGEADITLRATSGSIALGDLLRASLSPASAQVVWTKTAVTLSGNVSQQLLAASTTRKSFFVLNPGANDQIKVDVSGGDAAVGGRPVYPDGDYVFEGQNGPTNAVTVVGTNGQIIYVYTAA